MTLERRPPRRCAPPSEGRVLVAGRRRLRRGSPRLERHDRQASPPHRPGVRRRRRRADDRVRPGNGAAARDPWRAATTSRATARWTTGSSWTWAARRPSRSTPMRDWSASGPARRSADIDRATEPYGLAVPIGVVSGTGHRGPHARWRRRLADPPVRPDHRQPRGGRRRPRDRRAGPGERRRSTRTCSGACGAAAATSVSSRRSRSARTRWIRRSSPARSSTSFRAGREALRAYAEWTADVPDEMTTLITFMVPPADWELGDRVLMFLGFAWAGADRRRGRGGHRPAAGRLPARRRGHGSDALAHVPVGVRRGDAEGRPGVLAERVVRPASTTT